MARSTANKRNHSPDHQRHGSNGNQQEQKPDNHHAHKTNISNRGVSSNENPGMEEDPQFEKELVKVSVPQNCHL